MKFDKYVDYLRENQDLENAVHKNFPIRLDKDTSHATGKLSINSDSNYPNTKSSTIDISLAITNLGKKKLLTYPELLGESTPEKLREYGKALDIMEKEIARATEAYVNSIEEAFGRHGFMFLTRPQIEEYKKESPKEEN